MRCNCVKHDLLGILKKLSAAKAYCSAALSYIDGNIYIYKKRRVNVCLKGSAHLHKYITFLVDYIPCETEVG